MGRPSFFLLGWIQAGWAAAAMLGGQALAGQPEFFVPMADPPVWLLWDADLHVRAVGGYRENALLANTNRQSVAFGGWGGDFSLVHLPLDENSFELTFSGDERHYAHALDPGAGLSGATGEAEYVARAAYKRYIGKRWLPALTVQDAYTDNVFDAASVLQRYSVRAQLHDVTINPSVRYTMPHHVWVEGGYSWERDLFEDPLDSFWQIGPKAAIGWDYQDNCAVELSYRYSDLSYDTLPDSDGLGNPIDAGPQKFVRQYAALTWKHEWLANPRLRTSLQPQYIRTTDLSESMYYSSDVYALAGTVQLTLGRVTLEGRARWQSYNYDNEPASQIDSVNLLTQEEYQARIRMEVELMRKLFVISEFSWERLRSNRILNGYRSTLAWAGLEWRL